MHRSQLKKWLVVTSLALLTSLAQAGVGPRSKCDNEQSRLCDGLVAVFEFEEGLSSGSTPTYPDAVRRNSYGAGDLYEPDGIDVGAGSTQASVNNGKLGRNAIGYASPTDITGLKVWLKADAITGLNDGDAVTTWTDSSASGYNGSGSGGTRPIYKTGILNGKPVVRFDGVDDKLSVTTVSNLIANNAYTAFVVYKHTGGGTPILYRDTNEKVSLRLSSTGSQIDAMNDDGGPDTATDPDPVSGVFYIATAMHGSGNLSVGVGDTRNLTAVASGNTSSLTGTLWLGINPAGSLNPLKGDIAEVIIYNAALSETDRTKIESYLSNKYNIFIPYAPVGGTTTDDPDAAEFDGATQYLHTGLEGRGSGVLGNSYWTVAFWVYPTTSGATNQIQYIVSEKGKHNGATRFGTDIYLYNNGTVFGAAVRTYDPISEAALGAIWATNITTNAWHLIVATYRPRTIFANGEIAISIDGGARVTTAVSNNDGAALGVGTVIGRSADTASEGYFTGRLDQLTISGIAWTVDDIAAFWNGGAGREYPFVGN